MAAAFSVKYCFSNSIEHWNLRTNLEPLKWVSSLSNVYRYWWGSESEKNLVNIAAWCPATRQQHLNFCHGLATKHGLRIRCAVSSNQCKWWWWQSYLRTAALLASIMMTDAQAGTRGRGDCNSTRVTLRHYPPPRLWSSSLAPHESAANPLEILPGHGVTFPALTSPSSSPALASPDRRKFN